MNYPEIISIILNLVILVLLWKHYQDTKQLVSNSAELRKTIADQELQIKAGHEVMQKHIGPGWKIYLSNCIDMERAIKEAELWRLERKGKL